MKNFNGRNSYGHHGSKRHELAQHAHALTWIARIDSHTLSISRQLQAPDTLIDGSLPRSSCTKVVILCVEIKVFWEHRAPQNYLDKNVWRLPDSRSVEGKRWQTLSG